MPIPDDFNDSDSMICISQIEFCDKLRSGQSTKNSINDIYRQRSSCSQLGNSPTVLVEDTCEISKRMDILGAVG